MSKLNKWISNNKDLLTLILTLLIATGAVVTAWLSIKAFKVHQIELLKAKLGQMQGMILDFPSKKVKVNSKLIYADVILVNVYYPWKARALVYRKDENQYPLPFSQNGVNRIIRRKLGVDVTGWENEEPRTLYLLAVKSNALNLINEYNNDRKYKGLKLLDMPYTNDIRILDSKRVPKWVEITEDK